MPYLSLGDTDLYYEVHGEGPPFLFLPATAASGAVWKFFQVPEFSRDHRVIICDQRGTGKTRTRSTDFTTRAMAQDAAALLDHLGASAAIVCGHSIGGRVAQLLALDHPGKVNKLILASTGAATGGGGIPIPMCVELVEKGYARYLRDHSIQVGFSKAYAAQHLDKIEEFLKVRLGDPTPLENFLRIVVARGEHDTTARLKDIHVPTLVMVGEDEAHGSSSGMSHFTSSEMLARDIPGARYEVLPGQGHYYMFSDPVRMNRLMREFIAATG